MKRFARLLLAGLPLCLLLAPLGFAGDSIPKAAWKRGIGVPLENAGGRKPALAASGMIDDGYWQGAPVGGFGSGTFSRTYRGDFSRWHIKSGVHKYQTVWTNQFAMYQKSEGSDSVAQVLTAVDHRAGAVHARNGRFVGGVEVVRAGRPVGDDERVVAGSQKCQEGLADSNCCCAQA